MTHSRREWLRLKFRALIRAIGRRVPPGLRLVVGLLLIVGGAFGFLPVLGFWMIPLGLVVALLDLRAIWRWWRDRVNGKPRKRR